MKTFSANLQFLNFSLSQGYTGWFLSCFIRDPFLLVTIRLCSCLVNYGFSRSIFWSPVAGVTPTWLSSILGKSVFWHEPHFEFSNGAAQDSSTYCPPLWIPSICSWLIGPHFSSCQYGCLPFVSILRSGAYSPCPCKGSLTWEAKKIIPRLTLLKLSRRCCSNLSLYSSFSFSAEWAPSAAKPSCMRGACQSLTNYADSTVFNYFHATSLDWQLIPASTANEATRSYLHG